MLVAFAICAVASAVAVSADVAACSQVRIYCFVSIVLYLFRLIARHSMLCININTTLTRYLTNTSVQSYPCPGRQQCNAFFGYCVPENVQYVDTMIKCGVTDGNGGGVARVLDVCSGGLVAKGLADERVW
jgi:hypothetical protein